MISYYDSGIGGLTVVKQILELEPTLDIEYFCDYGFMPLGDRSFEQILNRMKVVCSYLFENSDLIVLVCNTASVNTIRHLQQVWLPENYPTKQVLGISKPIIELISEEYSNMSLQFNIILGTTATHQSGFYQKELKQAGFVNTLSFPCPTLAKEIEANDTSAITNSIQIIKDSIGTIEPRFVLLACTHYAFARDLIQDSFPDSVIIDPANFIASRNINYINRHPEFNVIYNSKLLIKTSKLLANQHSKISTILNRNDFEVELINFT